MKTTLTKDIQNLPENALALLEVRCPYERISKSDQKLYKCNSLCVKVTAGSAGEARCRKCGLNFLFGADNNAQVQTGVRIQPIN
mgnify:CR=1 FL=1|tara:strand:- start:1754 stop:2005 length:252 start_codon:yes stop_codon:yes gene_type:complete